MATGKDFNDDGVQTSKGTVRVLVEEEATAVAAALAGQSFTVSAVTERPFRRSPAAPFMTSTLQQEAGRKLRFSAQRAMQVAQRLYEQGFITYMRTDSTTLSEQALTAARSQAREMYGDAYVPDTPRRYERKVKNAQEAHEAIRPAGETFRTPEQAGRALSGDELRLYELIWMRTVASQMNDATGTSAQIRLVADVPAAGPTGAQRVAVGEEAEFSASGRVIAFPGFLRAYVEGEDDPDAELADREVVLPALAVGDVVEGTAFEPGLAHHPAAGPLHRGLAGQGHGGAGRGPPLDLRQRHRHHSGPGLRLEEGHRPGAQLHRLRRRRPAGALLRRPGRLRLHGQHGGRPRRDRLGPRGVAALAVALLLRHVVARVPDRRAAPNGDDGAASGGRPATAWASRPAWPPTWATSTPGRSTPSPSARGATACRSWPGSAATGPTSSAATTGPRCPTTCAPTS